MRVKVPLADVAVDRPPRLRRHPRLDLVVRDWAVDLLFVAQDLAPVVINLDEVALPGVDADVEAETVRFVGHAAVAVAEEVPRAVV